MKPQAKINSGGGETTRRSSALTIDGEVSLSFQDDLATTIHGAFEVAVEIAVLEITKLVGQAMGDVHKQILETMRENKSLKLLLQAAEQKLETIRGSIDHVNSPELKPNVGHHNRQFQRPQKADGQANEEAPLSNTTSDERYTYSVADEEKTAETLNGSFNEICEDGRVCCYDVNSTSKGICDSLKDPRHSTDDSSSCPEKEHSTGDGTDIGSEPEGAGLSSTETKEQLIKIKEEKSDQQQHLDPLKGAGPSQGPSFTSGGDEEFEPDSLALVQSKMLEDWRPDPHLKGSETDSLGPGPSHPMDEADLTSSPAGGLPVLPGTFAGVYQAEDRVALPHSSPQDYSIHIAPDFTGGGHVCRTCGHPFHRASELRRHISQQHRSKPSSPGTSRRPKRLMFPPGCSPYHCSECGRDFNRLENLKTHLRIHTGERPYTCSVCGVRFRHSGALTRHFRIHTGEKPYVCGECGKSFRNCSGLRLHQQSHSRQSMG